MHKYIMKRLILIIPVLVGVSLIIFTILDLSPGDPVRLVLGKEASAEAVEQYRDELGLNDPFAVRYARYIAGICRGDFGTSYTMQTKVMDEILLRLPVTLILASMATVMTVIIALPVGVLSATKQYSLFDTGSMIAALVGASMPPFWFGLLLIMLFSAKLGWFPSFGVSSLKSYILPAFTLCIFIVSILIRYTRSTMLETIRQDYITTARSKGASERRVIGKHALGNAMIPIVTVIGSRFAGFISGAVVVESVFSLPGLGTLLITGIKMKDIPVVMGTVIFMAFLLTLVNLAVDIIYAYLDPRIKSQYS